MNESPLAFETSSPLLGTPSGPRVRSGSSGRSGMNTAPPLLTVWSTPWSKNCPKNVNSELYGGERPTSVVTLGMNSVLWGTGTQSGASCGLGGSEQALGPTWPCVRTGKLAAATAAGFVEVWSTTRLLMVRGRESTTLPLSDLNDVCPGGPTGPTPGMFESSASRNTGVLASRGKTSSAAVKRSRPGNRLLHEPSTVRRP